jgi:tetratricopeptide repeat protein
MTECPGCRRHIEQAARFCTHCGAATAAAPGPRRAFWFFVAAMAVAVAGGGSIVLLARRTAELRKDMFRVTPNPTASALHGAPAVPAGSATDGPASGEPARARNGPARAAALFHRAEARRAEKDVDGAIPLYLAALQADPGLAEAEGKLALCYHLKGDTRRAARRYRRYLATNPPDAAKVRAILGRLQD